MAVSCAPISTAWMSQNIMRFTGLCTRFAWLSHSLFPAFRRPKRTASSPSARRLLPNPSTGLSTICEQRPVIAQDHLRGVVAGGAGAAMIEPFQGAAVVGVAQHRPRREQLVERQRAVEDIPTQQAEFPFEIERRQNLPADHACRKARRIFVH